jgi:hypothetical protein
MKINELLNEDRWADADADDRWSQQEDEVMTDVISNRKKTSNLSHENFVKILKKQTFGNETAPLGDAVTLEQNGDIVVSGEYDHTDTLIDSRGTFHNGNAYIEPEIENFANKYGRSATWNDADDMANSIVIFTY